MRKLITLITVAALTVILSDSFAGAASLDDAREAYQSGHYSTALEILRPLAQQGNAIAQLNLGRMYLRGDGVPQNYAEAFQWFNRSAKKGNSRAQAALGVMYLQGQGTLTNYELARAWLQKAAIRHEQNAFKFLGGMFRWGKGVERDYVESYKWFALGAIHGDKTSALERDEVARNMTSRQISAAKDRIHLWLEKHKYPATGDKI